MDKKQCIVCGEDNLVKHILKETIKEPFGGEETINIVEYYCENCESKGDFFNENEKKITKTLSQLKKNVATYILEDFLENKISLSSIERALELPQRTLTKWKNHATNPSSIGISLLKFLRLFPWLIDVAEKNYEYNDAQRIHLSHAFNQMFNKIQFNQNEFFFNNSITSSSPSIFINVEDVDSTNIQNNFHYTVNSTTVNPIPQNDCIESI